MCFIDDRLAWREDINLDVVFLLNNWLLKLVCPGWSEHLCVLKKAGYVEREKKNGRGERKSEPASALKARKE